jgi:hypothetical protein
MNKKFYKIETKKCKVELAKKLANTLKPEGVFSYSGKCPTSLVSDSAYDLFNKAYVDIIKSTDTLLFSLDTNDAFISNESAFELLHSHLDEEDSLIEIGYDFTDLLSHICFSIKTGFLKFSNGDIGTGIYGAIELVPFTLTILNEPEFAIEPYDAIGNILNQLFDKSLSDEAASLLIIGLSNRDFISEEFDVWMAVDDYLPQLVDYPASLSSFILYLCQVDSPSFLIPKLYSYDNFNYLLCTEYILSALNTSASKLQLQNILKFDVISVLQNARWPHARNNHQISIIHILLAKVLYDHNGSIASMKEHIDSFKDKVILSDLEIFNITVSAFNTIFWGEYNPKIFNKNLLTLWKQDKFLDTDTLWLQECINRAIMNQPNITLHLNNITSGYFRFESPVPSSYEHAALEVASFAAKYGEIELNSGQASTMINKGTLKALDLAIKHLNTGNSKTEYREAINKMIDKLKPKLSSEHIKTLSVHLKPYFYIELKKKGLNKESINDWMVYSESNKATQRLVTSIMYDDFTNITAAAISPTIKRKKQVIFAIKELNISPYDLMVALKDEKLKGYCMPFICE